MTGAGQVSLISSVQESWYTQWELAAPPHQTQPYFGSAVRHRLQSDRPTEQLNKVTETRERKEKSVRNLYIYIYYHTVCQTAIQYVPATACNPIASHLSHTTTITWSHIGDTTGKNTHHTDPQRCRSGSCFFSSRWSWLGIPPSRQNRHTETRTTINSLTSRSTTCDMVYELMLCTSMCKAATVCVKMTLLWELMKQTHGLTDVHDQETAVYWFLLTQHAMGLLVLVMTFLFVDLQWFTVIMNATTNQLRNISEWDGSCGVVCLCSQQCWWNQTTARTEVAD